MKTTSGKTRTTRRSKRNMRIHEAPPSGKRVQVRWGASLKQGLEEFFKEVLKPKGWKRVSCFGNALCVEHPEHGVRNYVAYEEEVKKK